MTLEQRVHFTSLRTENEVGRLGNTAAYTAFQIPHTFHVTNTASTKKSNFNTITNVRTIGETANA